MEISIFVTHARRESRDSCLMGFGNLVTHGNLVIHKNHDLIYAVLVLDGHQNATLLQFGLNSTRNNSLNIFSIELRVCKFLRVQQFHLRENPLITCL